MTTIIPPTIILYYIIPPWLLLYRLLLFYNVLYFHEIEKKKCSIQSDGISCQLHIAPILWVAVLVLRITELRIACYDTLVGHVFLHPGFVM